MACSFGTTLYRSCPTPPRPELWPARPRRRLCMSSSVRIVVPPPPVITSYDVLRKYIRQPSMPHPFKEDEEGNKRREYLLEETARTLRRSSKPPLETLKLIDTIQRLGIAYYLDDEITALLQNQFSLAGEDDDLIATALRFRLLRHNGFPAAADVFLKFMDERGKFKELSMPEGGLGLLSLYEASYTGARGEETIMEEAKVFSRARLQQWLPQLPQQLRQAAAQALAVPTHRRMARLEARRYIQEYGGGNRELIELAVLDYNRVQAQHQMELTELTRWWKQLGLVEKLPFARDRPLECFLWSVGLLPEPKYSTCRIELAKTIAVLLVIDDVFDTYGKMDDLLLFTDVIKRWDLAAIETLPEYMKICYMALYNTTNEICYKVLKENGWSVLPYLKSTWIDMIEGFMREAKWFNGGRPPNLDEYVENGVSTAGAYMALVHLFFLIGEGINEANAQLLTKPYPKLFTAAGQILRLWDDLGTAKEEQERGDFASSIHLYMKEKNLGSEEEGRSRILEKINNLWKDLNGEVMYNHTRMPLPIIKVALNMARAAQVVYNHDQHTYFSSVDNYVEALFFTPLAI
ncbi:geraniol synthase, chloroplastic-like [Andrographis paniculata]|uniref:geraniol synthase, chloroplastic-like n=1 Tax=Andrographis paniculata TaxID=175694 RepID=UPI0021E92F75|nr:geraniol synthase, chloroplastic-like [Andrographis paniculata]QJA18339.1 terpene synthase 24 [Andrographis paniculata]